MSYTPIEVLLGELAETTTDPKIYDLTPHVPVGATEVLLYSWVTTKMEGPSFQRGYYEFYTADGNNEFKQYMNIATGQAAVTVNSFDLWFPVGEGKLTIKLYHPEDKKSIAYRSGASQEWSQVFILGYRA